MAESENSQALNLEVLYQDVIKSCDEQSRWYNINKGQKTWPSKIIRFSSVILFGLGGVFPLIGKTSKVDFTTWGYISIAIAGILLFLDRFFGFSSGWIRYTLTEMEINKRKADLQFQWKIEMIRIELSKELASIEKKIELMTMLKDFSKEIADLVMQETNNWAAEFQTNISELQKMASAKLESGKPGSIKVIVKNGEKYGELIISTDGIERKRIRATETLIDNVNPGPHEVSVTAKIAEQRISVNVVVMIEAGKMSEATLMLPLRT